MFAGSVDKAFGATHCREDLSPQGTLWSFTQMSLSGLTAQLLERTRGENGAAAARAAFLTWTGFQPQRTA